MIRNVLITGGNGNVGRHVVDELKQRYNVTIFDRVSPSQAPRPWETDVPMVLGDLCNLGDCMRAITFARADAIVHLAALAGPTELAYGVQGRTQQRMPEDETMRVNTMGTFYLIDAARRLGVGKLAMASTYYVLGLGNRITNTPFQVDYLPIDEEHPCRPEDTYGLSKLLDEEILRTFSRGYGMQTAALRLMGVLIQDKPVPFPEPQPNWVGGPIGWTWQYVNPKDVAQAFQLTLEAEGLDPFEVFYVSTDSAIAEDTRALVESQYPDLKEMAANLQGRETIISIKKAQAKLGYQPRGSWRNM